MLTMERKLASAGEILNEVYRERMRSTQGSQAKAKRCTRIVNASGSKPARPLSATAWNALRRGSQVCNEMAEGEGFEPPGPFRAQRFSRPPVSTAHPPLRF